MKLPRYIQARSVVGELSRRDSISPAEAANLQIAKYGAIASVAGSIANTVNMVAEIKAEEEYTSATSQVDNSLLSIDNALSQKPYSYDDSGKLVADETNIAIDEINARKAIVDDVRSTIKSPRAKREFDKYVSDVARKRNSFYQAKAVERDTSIITMRLQDDVVSMLNTGNYDGARQRIKMGMANGVLDPPSYSKLGHEIDKREVTDQVFDVLNAPLNEIDTDDVNAVLDKLQGDDFDLLEGREKFMYINQLNSLLADFDKNLNALNAEQQRGVFYDLFAKAKRGQLTLAELHDSGLTDKSYEGRLLTMMTSDEGESDSVSVKAYEGALRTLQLPLEGDWGEAADGLRDKILMDESLSGEDADKLITKIEGMEKGIFADKMYQNLSSQAYQMVTGFEEGILGQITTQLQSQYKVTTEVAREFQQALIRKAEQLGPRRMDELDKWVEEQAKGFRVMASQKNLQKIGVKTPVPRDGSLTEEYRNTVNGEISDWFYKQYQADPTATINMAESTIAEVERLTGWQLAVPGNANGR